MKARIIEMVKDACALPEIDISENSEIALLSLDSLSFVGLIVNIESEFNITIDDEQLNIQDYKTVKDIILMIKTIKNKDSKD